jgi:NADH-quinone oxidoreductase subunit H
VDFTYSILVSLFPAAASWPLWLLVALCVLVPGGIIILVMALGPLLYVYAERKISAFMQDRLGPMRVGPYGLLQTLADTVKLLMKEAIFPRGVNRVLFVLGPSLVVTGAFMGLVIVPFGSRFQVVDLNVGLLFVAAVSSLSTVGIIMAGWASNNKYSLFGAMRSAAQIVSYEIPAIITMLSVVIIVGSLSLQDIVWAQAGGLRNWFIFRYFPIMPVAFLLFYMAGLAESNRTPFDIPEAESELVAGFHTEYSGFFFAMFFLAEYTEMFVISSVASVLFLGGWNTPFPGNIGQSLAFVGLPQVGLGPLWLVAKAWTLMLVMMWLRWTLPRLRVDQLLYIAWKVFLPVSLVITLAIGALVMIPATSGGFPWDRWVGWPVVILLFLYLMYVLAGAWRWRVRRVRELAA